MTLVAVLLLVLLGYAPARLVTGARWASFLAAPVVAALLLATFGTVLCAVARLPAGAAFAATAVTAIGCAVGLRARQAAEDDSPWVLAIPVGGLIPFLTVVRAPDAWDARSVWWFHAKWWAEGGSDLVRAMRNPAFAFSHSDYPPLTPATIGALWSATGTRALPVAQVVTAVLSLAAVSLLGYAVWRVVRVRTTDGRAAVYAAVLVAATCGAARVLPATNGYVDFLWGATAASAAVLLLASPCSPSAVRWGALALAAATLTKNEALIVAIGLAVVAVVRYRRAPAAPMAMRWMGAALVPGLGWAIVARALGAQSEDAWRIGELVRLDPMVTARIRPSIRAVAEEVAALTVATALVGLAAWWCARHTRRTLCGSTAPWLWYAWAIMVVPLIAAYVLSPYDLQWHLDTSITRTTLAPTMVLLSELAIGTAALALERFPGLAPPSDRSEAADARPGADPRARTGPGPTPAE